MGDETPLTLEIINDFGGVNNNGTIGLNITNVDWEIPDDVAKNSFYGNGLTFNGKINEKAAIRISNLSPEQQLTFAAMCSNKNATVNNETYMKVKGTEEKIDYVDAAVNTNTALLVENISPKPDGTVDIEFGYGPNNVQPNRFFYINAVTLMPAGGSSAGVPNPQTSELLFLHNNLLVLGNNIANVSFFSFNGQLLYSALNVSNEVLLPEGSGIVKISGSNIHHVLKKI